MCGEAGTGRSAPPHNETRSIEVKLLLYGQVHQHRCLLQDLLVDDLAVRVDLVNDRDTRGELSLDDLLGSKVLEVLDHRTQRVAVGSNKNRLALLHERLDVLLEERQHTVGGELQRLATRGLDVVRAAPGVHLLLAELGTSVVLVQTGELTVVTLVQGLVLHDVNALLANSLQLDVQRLLSTLQGRSEGDAVKC